MLAFKSVDSGEAQELSLTKNNVNLPMKDNWYIKVIYWLYHVLGVKKGVHSELVVIRPQQYHSQFAKFHHHFDPAVGKG